MEKVQRIIIAEEGQVNCRNSLIKSWVTGRWSYIYDHPITKETLKLQQLSAYHLYVISDDNINDNDWCYHEKRKCVVEYWRVIGTCEELFCKKIITTTNQKLNLSIPIIEPKFISDVLELYKHKRLDSLTLVKVPYNEGGEILISEDNFINLKLIKQTFTREEVYEIIENSFNFGLSYVGVNTGIIKEWFEDNY